MKTVELFCGMKSFSDFMDNKGHETYTVDHKGEFSPNLIHDMRLDMPQILIDRIKDTNIIWMSPPCTTFSMASGNKHWDKFQNPKTQDAIDGHKMLMVCKEIAENCIQNGQIFFIENPTARARWFLPAEWIHPVWYCQYGDCRAKPTDIWTNLPNWIGKKCFNGNQNCHHQPAPRGSKTGTQGIKDTKTQSLIPSGLFEDIFYGKRERLQLELF